MTRSKAVRDPKGNELKMIVLQVMERGDQGPTMLRVRYDHETVELEGTTEIQREFMLVWTPIHAVLGEMRLEDIANELIVARAEIASCTESIETVTHDNRSLREQLGRAQGELTEKTSALREIQKERDPARFDRAVQARTAELEAKVTAVASAGATEVATLRSRVAELEASKRKLREALDRAKDR